MQAVHASTAYNLCMCTWMSVLHACTPADSCDIQDIPFRLSCPSVWGQISTKPPQKKSRKMLFFKLLSVERLSFIVSIFSFMFAVLKFAVAFSINSNCFMTKRKLLRDSNCYCFMTRRENCYVIKSVIVSSYQAMLLFVTSSPLM